MSTTTEAPVAKVKLFHPDFAGLVYGPDPETAIKFGVRGNCEPHYAIIDEDDPLLADLLDKDKTVRVIKDTGPTEVFLCPIDNKQFAARAALVAHISHTADEAHGTLAGLLPEVKKADEKAAATAGRKEPPATVTGLAAYAAAKTRAAELGIDPTGLKLADLTVLIEAAESAATAAAFGAPGASTGATPPEVPPQA